MRLGAGMRLVCEACWKEAERTDRSSPLLSGGDPPEGGPPRTLYGRSAYEWSDTLGLILHRFKYGGFRTLAERLAAGLTRTIEADARLRRAELLVPVPLTRPRAAERGFNQSELLARAAAKRLGIVPAPRVVRRIGRSPSQTKLNPAERRRNVRGVFRVRDPGAVRGKRLLVIDDVLTTGATAAELAAALEAAGALEVSVATVARARAPYSPPSSSFSSSPRRRAPSRKKRSPSPTG
jgi:ComF family protein